MWFLEENPDVGVGGESDHSSLSLSPESVVSPSESLSRGSLCLLLCLQLGVSYFENRHCDTLWELKDLLGGRTGQGSYLLWRLYHVHIWERRLGRVWKHLEMTMQGLRYPEPECSGWLQPGELAIELCSHMALPDQDRVSVSRCFSSLASWVVFS